MHLPPEFELVAACCRWPPAERDAALASWRRPVDWDRFAAVVARHRVEGLVHAALAASALQPPPELAERLAGEARQIARDNLSYAAEARRLAEAMAAAGIPFLFLKGVTLNLLAYGTLAIKKSADLDLAVDPDRYAAAVAAMQEAGYACILPEGAEDAGAILRAVRANKHSIWWRRGLIVELHYQFVDSPLMLRPVTVHAPSQQVEVAPGLALPTLADEELFAYLCVHGASHAWSRLKWLADVNAFLSHRSDEAVEHLYRRAIELGGGRAGGQALLLCADLFGRRLPAAVEAEVRGDRAHRFLARVAVKTMVHGAGDVELDSLVLGTVGLHFSHLRLMKGWRFKAAEIRRKLASVDSSGAPGGPLSALTAGPRWLLRRARTAWQSGRADR